MKLSTIILAAALPLALLMAVGCDKDKERGTSQLTVKMMDAPVALEAVYVEVLEVNVSYDESDVPEGYEGWTTLSTEAGIYNLLELRNGVTATLSDGHKMPSGKISQIRLLLGSNNSVVVGGISYPLATPSAQSSGLKINVHKVLEPGKVYEITLDFDAEQSIVVQGNGGYSLKPVITVNAIVEL